MQWVGTSLITCYGLPDLRPDSVGCGHLSPGLTVGMPWHEASCGSRIGILGPWFADCHWSCLHTSADCLLCCQMCCPPQVMDNMYQVVEVLPVGHLPGESQLKGNHIKCLLAESPVIKGGYNLSSACLPITSWYRYQAWEPLPITWRTVWVPHRDSQNLKPKSQKLFSSV